MLSTIKNALSNKPLTVDGIVASLNEMILALHTAEMEQETLVDKHGDVVIAAQLAAEAARNEANRARAVREKLLGLLS